MAGKVKLQIYLFGFIRSNGSKIKSGIERITNQLQNDFDITWTYYGPIILDEFDINSVNYDGFFPFNVKLIKTSYNIQKYVNLCKTNNLEIRNKLLVYNHRTLSFLDQFLNLIRYMKQNTVKETNCYLILRIDNLDITINSVPLKNYARNMAYNKIHIMREGEPGIIEDRFFILNNYALSKLNQIKLEHIIEQCKRSDAFAEEILFKLLHKEKLEDVTKLVQCVYPVSKTLHSVKYSLEFFEKVKRLYG